MLKPKGAWWTALADCGDGLVPCGRCGGVGGTRGNGVLGHGAYLVGTRGTGPGMTPLVTPLYRVYFYFSMWPLFAQKWPIFWKLSIFHENHEKHPFSALFGHRTDEFGPLRHIWLASVLFWKWTDISDPSVTEVQYWHFWHFWHFWYFSISIRAIFLTKFRVLSKIRVLTFLHID